jgi:excinuclease UvrABC nuclease subunit
VGHVRYWRVSSKLETSLILYELTRHAYPETYLRRLHLRMPWFLGLAQSSAFARLAVSNRLSSRNSARYGPFRTRDAALLYQQQLLGLHQIRRCVENLTVSPDHPGCIYGEMNQCLRPCQCAVTPEEYATEALRVADFLQSAGKSALLPLAATRDRAAAELDFEQAALAHKRMEKVQAAMAARDPVVTAAQSFHGIAVTRANEADSVNLWPMMSGYWQTPINLYLPVNQEQGARSLDSLVRERIQAALQSPSEEGNRLEHLALFSRWYYSSWRDGPWFAFENVAQLNYRRLVKAIAQTRNPPPKP